MKSRTVLLLLSNATSIGRGIIQGVVDYAHRHTTWTFLPVLPEAGRLPRSFDPRPGSIDAVIGGIGPEIISRWPPNDRPLLINTFRGGLLPEGEGANVVCDDLSIVGIAARYLRSKGLEHFAYFGPRPAISRMRAQAFIDHLQAPGRPVSWLRDDHAEASQVCSPGRPVPRQGNDGDYARLTAALRELPRPCGVLAFNDVWADRVIRLIGLAGLNVPRDFAVLGVDNDTLLSIFSPVTVSSIRIPFERIGYEAARVLDRMFQGEAPPMQPILIPPTEIVERHSTDFPGEGDWLAVQTARLIQRRACEPVKVPDMLSELPASYRTIDRRFRQAFRRSLQDEITRVRMAKACRLLKTTSLCQAAIALQTGYTDPNYFNSAFRKYMGLPPGAYRQQQKTRDSKLSAEP